jgi:hypothetical protein
MGPRVFFRFLVSQARAHVERHLSETGTTTQATWFYPRSCFFESRRCGSLAPKPNSSRQVQGTFMPTRRFRTVYRACTAAVVPAIYQSTFICKSKCLFGMLIINSLRGSLLTKNDGQGVRLKELLGFNVCFNCLTEALTGKMNGISSYTPFVLHTLNIWVLQRLKLLDEVKFSMKCTTERPTGCLQFKTVLLRNGIRCQHYRYDSATIITTKINKIGCSNNNNMTLMIMIKISNQLCD